ncbi:MAG: FixH family protein [Anaerolineae bacterium]|nr:FixH family protein [Anaerolineae bacterium]
MTLRRRPMPLIDSVWNSRFRSLAGLLLILIVFALPPLVGAHGYLIRAIPEDRSVLERSPARVQYWFSEALEPDFSTITVRDTSGTAVAEGGVSENDDKLMTARLPSDLPDGAYIVDLRLAFASDGHVIFESRTFFVGETVAGVGGVSSSNEAVSLEVVWRALMLTSTMVLMGVFWLYVLVLVPAWGSDSHPAGRLPPRVMNRLYLLAFASLALALVANVIALVQQTMVLFGVDAGRVIGEGLWSVVRIGTRFGDTWNARMFLLVLIAGLLGASLYFRREQPALVRPFWSAAAWAAPLVLFTWNIAAHSAGSLVLPWLAIFVDWLHGAAVGIWAGGLVSVVLVLPVALRPYADEARRQALLAVLHRYSRVAIAAMLVVVATGIYSATNWFTETNDVTTTYGGALLFKIVLVAALVGIGAAHHVALRPQRYARWSALMARVQAFMPTLRLEGVVAVAVILAAAWLAATPVPQPTLPPQTEAPGGTETVGHYVITTAITPGGPGTNTYDVQVSRDGQPVNQVDVQVELVNPTLARRGDQHVAEDAGDGLYVAAGADVSQTGDWQALVDVSDGQTRARAAFPVSIREDAAVITSRDPNVLNVVALLAVLGAIGFALYPSMRRFVRWLNPRPISLLVSVLAVVGLIAFLILSVWLAELSNRQAEAALYPLPQIVNTVLPDADSLVRGESLIDSACSWSPDNRDLSELAERLIRLRDEELFAFTQDGWRSLPPCADLTDTQRWDIVNYLRTLDG